MYRPYLGPGVQDPRLPPSPYMGPVPEEADEGQSPTMQMAMGRARNRSSYGVGGDSLGGLSDVGEATSENEGRAKPLTSKYAPPPGAPEEIADDLAEETGGGGGGESPYLSKPASWTKTAPEAAGTESFSTTPKNEGPRDKTPIEKGDLPRVNSEPAKSPSKWDAVRAKDEEIQKRSKDMGSWWFGLIAAASPAIARVQLANLQGMRQDRDDLAREAAYFDDSKGAHQKFVEEERTKRANARAAGQVEVAKIRAAEKEAEQQSIKNTGRVDESGKFVYIDPKTGAWREPAGIPGKVNVLDQDNPEAPAPKPYLPSFAKPKAAGGGGGVHNVPENVPGYLEDGVMKKNPYYVSPEKRRAEHETPEAKETAEIESKARSEGAIARREWKGNPRNTMEKSEAEINAGADAAYRDAYHANGGKKPMKGDKRNVRDDKTGAVEVWTFDGKQFAPPKKPTFASSHR